MQPLGLNAGGYRGETIGLPKVLLDIDAAAREKNWEREVVFLPSSTDARPLEFIAYKRLPAAPRLSIYLSSGMHGDEPAGPLAALRLFCNDAWPADAALWFCPCLNPTGFSLNTRENYQGIDLNRDYRHFKSEEVRAHIAWLEQQPRFDLALCLHEDWESKGFYIYEVNPENKPSLAQKIIDAAAKVCPIEHAEIVDSWPANLGIIRPNINPEEREQWPEAMYLVQNKTRLGYTMESPSDFPLETRVSVLVTAVKAALEQL